VLLRAEHVGVPEAEINRPLDFVRFRELCVFISVLSCANRRLSWQLAILDGHPRGHLTTVDAGALIEISTASAKRPVRDFKTAFLDSKSVSEAERSREVNWLGQNRNPVENRNPSSRVVQCLRIGRCRLFMNPIMEPSPGVHPSLSWSDSWSA
jgi:hypothetical protein